MNFRFLLRLGCSAALALGAASATMVERLSLEQLVEGSERIVQGRCLRQWSAWDAAHQFIWTHSELEVSDALKGAAAQTVVVSEPGGEVGDLGMRIEGMPAYSAGEEMVLFLYRTPVGYWRARGLGQGKFRVLADPRGGEPRVRADLQGAALTEPAAGAAPGVDLRSLDNAALSSFKSQVRALVNRAGAAAR